jgi:hypothetical protein
MDEHTKNSLTRIAVFAVISALIYFFYDKPKHEKRVAKRNELISNFARNTRMGMPFEPIRLSFSGEECRREHLGVLILWIMFWSGFAILSAFNLAKDSPGSWMGAVAILMAGAAIVYFGIRAYRRGFPVALPGITELHFEPNKIVRVMKTGVRHEYIFGPKLAIYVGIDDEVRLIADIVEPAGELRIPLGVVGAGELLARARHSGATVEFVKDAPPSLIQQFKALPSWKPGYFDQPAPVVVPTVELCCRTCGGSAQYVVGLPSYACQYCGSGKLASSSAPPA